MEILQVIRKSVGGLATKFSVWCGEVTAQKHLFLINLLNQFGSSKPIPLTG